MLEKFLEKQQNLNEKNLNADTNGGVCVFFLIDYLLLSGLSVLPIR